MRFNWDGTEFELSFEREIKKVQVRDKTYKNGGKVWRWEKSKHPYTTAVIRQVVPDTPAETWPVAFEAEVGCLDAFDTYNIEQGRLWALRKLSTYVPAEMRPVIWGAYHGRQKKLTDKQRVKQLRTENAKLKAELKLMKDVYAKMVNEGMDI